MAVSIVSVNAEQVVRDGGVFNRASGKGWNSSKGETFDVEPGVTIARVKQACTSPDDCCLDGGHLVGRVVVVDVHHADSPACGGSNGDPAEPRLYEEWRCPPRRAGRRMALGS